MRRAIAPALSAAASAATRTSGPGVSASFATIRSSQGRTEIKPAQLNPSDHHKMLLRKLGLVHDELKSTKRGPAASSQAVDAVMQVFQLIFPLF